MVNQEPESVVYLSETTCENGYTTFLVSMQLAGMHPFLLKKKREVIPQLESEAAI